MSEHSAAAIIVAGGKGVRMKQAVRKQYIALGDTPVLARTLRVFDGCSAVGQIFLAVPKQDFEFCREKIISPLKLEKKITLVAGGKRRQDSVYNGLLAAGISKCRMAVIHDGVRPFVRPEQIVECIDVAELHGACILGIPAFDTLKRAAESGCITKTLERGGVWLAQTPQAFLYSTIIDAHEQAKSDGFTGTDDASLVERIGGKVAIIPGSRYNIKITAPEDLELANALARISGFQP